MAQSTLVDGLVDDGLKLTYQLVRSGLPIAAALWFKRIDDAAWGTPEWEFFLVSPLVDELGPGEVYKRAYDALRSMPDFDAVLASISLGMIKMIGEKNPITQAVFKIIKLHGDGPPIYVARCRLGDIEAENLEIIYVERLPAPWQQVVIKTPVKVEDPRSPQVRARMVPIGGSEISLDLAGLPSSSVPAGTVVNAQVLGTEAEPNPVLRFKLPDGRLGYTVKSNTEPVQGGPLPRQ